MTRERIITAFPIRHGHLRIRVEVGDQHCQHDYPTSSLPGWINGLEAGAEDLERGCIRSAMVARAMAMTALKDGDSDLAGIAALWLALYGPGRHALMTLDEIMEVPSCMATVSTDAEGKVWQASIDRATPITRH